MTNIEDKLQAVTKAYYSRLPDRYQELHQAWQNIINNHSHDQSVNLSREFHKLAGSAGMYKASEISDIARNIELKLLPYAETAHMDDKAYIDAEFDKLYNLIQSYI